MCKTRNARPSPLPLRNPLIRKARTKTRKPKFLSLRRQLNSFSQPESDGMTHQLDLFPLQPENLVQDRDMINMPDDHNVNVDFLFDNCDGGATLNGILSGEYATITLAPAATAVSLISEEDSFSPPSLSYGYNYSNNLHGRGTGNPISSSLVRSAMRNCKDRDVSEAEERWVCYSEVVEKTEPLEEDTSHSVTATRDREDEEEDEEAGAHHRQSSSGGWSNSTITNKKYRARTKFGSLLLKLDYEGILSAWSDKGPLYVQGLRIEFPQTVPDILHDLLAYDGSIDGRGCSVGDIWNVPEWGLENLGKMEEMKGRDGWKTRQRQASVLRYKEKRQSRLFSKRIRYEVRKLNAEKRPRMKVL